MEIVVLDKYLIKSDSYSYMLATRLPKLKGGGFNLLEQSYFGSLEKVFNEIKERELRNSEITTLTELSHLLQDLTSRIETAMGEVKRVIK